MRVKNIQAGQLGAWQLFPGQFVMTGTNKKHNKNCKDQKKCE